MLDFCFKSATMEEIIMKIFPTKLPYITKNYTYIPDDAVSNYQIIPIKSNDFLYLIAYYSLKNPKTTDRESAEKLLNSCKKSRTSEWRRIKRLKELKLI